MRSSSSDSARVTVSLPRRRSPSPAFLGAGALAGTILPPTFLVAVFFFFFLRRAAARRLRPARPAPGLAWDRARRAASCFGVAAWLRSAALRASSSALRFSAASRSALSFSSSRGAARGILLRHRGGLRFGDAGIGQGGGAAGLFLVGQLAQHHAARGRRGLGGGLGASARRGRGFSAARRACPRALAARGRAQRCASSPPPPPWCGHG